MSESSAVWARTILQIDSCIKQAIELLNETSLKIVLVVDEFDVFIGTITDGDIRRGLLNGLELTSSIDLIINKEALVVPIELGHREVIELMLASKIQQIPIVDEESHVIGLHLWDQIDVFSERNTTMVIMAGGKGTRLQPQTETCPKPLLPIAGKPILEHIIERAKSDGFSRFILSVHYLGHMIEEYFGNGEAFGVKVEYLREESPLGTAGALSLLHPLPSSPILVTNGDVLTDINYGELLDFHNQHSPAATMAVRVHEWQNPFGVVDTQGIEIIGYEEKPISRVHINAGIYVIEPEAMSLLKKGEPCDMPTLFERLRLQGEHVVAYPIHEPWLDIGRPVDLDEAQSKKFNKGRVIKS
jgi:dTDP-glucose pyrophosphorylase